MLLTLLIECIYLEIIYWYEVTWIFMHHEYNTIYKMWKA